MVSGGDDQDFLYGGGGADSVFGGDGDDDVEGGSGDDKGGYFGGVYGGNGNDNVYGGSGNDIVSGDDGNDKLYGGNGNDLLAGGKNQDKLWGGDGADTFDFNAAAESTVGANHDIIKDFDHDEADLIDLKGIDAKSGPAGDQAFTFIGDTPFSNKSGELRFHNGKLSGDVDGNGTADFEIKVAGVDSLSASDLVL